MKPQHPGDQLLQSVCTGWHCITPNTAVPWTQLPQHPHQPHVLWHIPSLRNLEFQVTKHWNQTTALERVWRSDTEVWGVSLDNFMGHFLISSSLRGWLTRLVGNQPKNNGVCSSTSVACLTSHGFYALKKCSLPVREGFLCLLPWTDQELLQTQQLGRDVVQADVVKEEE